MEHTSISLNKYISSTGSCSRREADKLIEAGRVTINGKVAKKGNRVERKDRVIVDGVPIKNKFKPVYLAFNKPPGITCTTNPQDKDNIIDYIGYSKRIFPVGRLDKASSGLILLTNDGDIVNKILRKENKKEKEYIVTVNPTINSKFLKDLAEGVPILGKRTQRCKVTWISKSAFNIVLTQGLNRQIRRMCKHFGYKVQTLKRIRIMHISLGKLEVGKYRHLSKTEVDLIFDHTRSNKS